MNNVELTPTNLAFMGIMDDFYNAVEVGTPVIMFY